MTKLCEDHDAASNKEDLTYLGSMDSKQVASSAILLPITSSKVAGSLGNLLYSLPIELRLMVYEYVFVANDETKAVHLHVHDEIVCQCMFKESGNNCHSIAALLYTCRGIYDEAVNILYNNTSFEIALYHPRADENCTSLQHKGSQAQRSRVLNIFSRLTRSFKMMGSMFIMANRPEVGREIASSRLTSFLTAITYEKHSRVLDIRVNILPGLAFSTEDDVDEGSHLVKLWLMLREHRRDVIIDFHGTSRTTNDVSTSCFRWRYLGVCRNTFIESGIGRQYQRAQHLTAPTIRAQVSEMLAE